MFTQFSKLMEQRDAIYAEADKAAADHAKTASKTTPKKPDGFNLTSETSFVSATDPTLLAVDPDEVKNEGKKKANEAISLVVDFVPNQYDLGLIIG